MDARFYFDVMCPWTWLSSRWLLDVAGQRDVNVTWRTMSLPLLNEGQEIPPGLLAAIPDLPERMALGGQILRVMESLREDGRNDDIARFYDEVGTRIHVQGLPPERSLLEDAAKAAGVEDHLSAADDASWDVHLRSSLAEAMDGAGPDVGSPVLMLDGHDRGAFGPIVSPPPEGEDALRLWDAMVTMLSIPTFFELKRGRAGQPVISGAP